MRVLCGAELHGLVVADEAPTDPAAAEAPLPVPLRPIQECADRSSQRGNVKGLHDPCADRERPPARKRPRIPRRIFKEIHERRKSSAGSENFSGPPVMRPPISQTPDLLVQHRPPEEHLRSAAVRVAAGCQNQPIPRQTHFLNGAGVAFERCEFRLGSEVPNVHKLVLTAGNQRPAVWGEDQGIDAASVSVKGEEWIERFDVPKDNLAVGSPGREGRTIRGKGLRGDGDPVAIAP
jgi:hypothetical protein